MDKGANSDWQKPFVDVFKKFKVFDSTREVKRGQVLDTQVLIAQRPFIAV